VVQPGSRIGEWVVEEVLDGDGRYRCHRVDSTFRKAVLTAFRGPDRQAAEQQAGHLARLHHPNIGGVLGATFSGDELFVVAELVQGSSLRSFLRAAEAMPTRTVVTVAYELADALSAAHERGVVHGDVRPESVLLGLDGKARLVGFERMGTSDDWSTVPRYAAPEVVVPGARPTMAGDAYAFGVVLYELARGGRGEVLHPREASLDESVPRPLRDLVASLTHPDPVVRPTLAKARQVLHQLLLDLSEVTIDDTFRAPVEAEDAPPPMPTRIGRYDVVRELGRGGVGVVYEGADPVLERRVALKLLIAGSWARPREVQRFKLEAQAVARLDHPGIVKILDIGGDLEGAWFAMEFVDGPSLADALEARGGRLPWREAVAVAAQVARALQHAHEQGLLHRDVKPNNVLLDGDRAKLADFGLALDAASDHTRLTGTGQVLGTPTYMAPEQAAGELDRMGPHTDVYGLGVLLYEALTGRVPYEGATPLQVIANILGGDAAPPRRHVPDLPRELDTITLKALRLDPRDRYASAAGFADDLERLLAGDSILAADPTWLERLGHSARRHRRVLTAAVAAGVVVLLAFVGLRAAVDWSVERRREGDAHDALDGVRRRMADARAAGRPAEADEAFRTFVGRPEHAGTTALVEAWRARADELGAAGDAAGRLSALSSAYLAARRPPDVDGTLVALATAAHEEGDFELVVALGELLGSRYPHLAGQVKPLVRDALAARRHLQRAAGLVAGDGQARAAAVLAEGVRTRWTRVSVTPDPREPGRSFVYDGHVLAVADRRLEPVYTTDFPSSPLAVPVGDHTALLQFRGPTGQARTLSWDGRALTPAPPARLGELNTAVAGDLDADGVTELWAGAWRRLYRLDAGPDGWTPTSAHAETNESNSQIADVLATDVDGDGRQDLVVAAGEWGAYDVRWFSWDAGRGREGAAPGLGLRGRIRLGVVHDLEATRAADGSARVVLCKIDEFPNLRVFPESAPFGAAAGVWELSFGADGAVAGRHVFDGACRRVRAGDFDGDGLQDFAVSDDHRSAVALRRADDGFDTLWLEDTDIEEVMQADDDAAAELVVWDDADNGRVWLLGVDGGPDVLPPLSSPHVPAAVVPDANHAFVESWARADDLVGLGRLADAQRAFRDLATLRWGSAEGIDALLRSADLAFARGAFAEAAATYLEADGMGTEGALAAAIRSRRAGRDEAGELELLRLARSRDALDAEGADRLALLQPSAQPPVVVTFDAPLDPRFEVPEPLWVTRSPGRGELALDPDDAGVLLRLPVTPTGRWLGVELDGAFERTEWGSTLSFGFERRGTSAPFVSVELAGRGGGEVVERRVICVTPWGQAGGVLPPGQDVPLHVSVWTQVDGTVRCSGEGASPAWLGERRPMEGAPWPDGPWDFVVRSTSQVTASGGVSLRSLTLHGVVVDPAAPVTDAARRGLVDGVPTGEVWGDLVAAAHREDVTGVVAGLAALPADDPRSEQVRRWLLHPRLQTWGGVLRASFGDRWPEELAGAWSSPLLSQGRRDPELRDMLLRWTDGAERVEPTSEPDRALVQLLLLTKGATALHHGQWAVARAALERAVALGLPAASSDDDVKWTRTVVAVGLVDLAELATHDADPDGAFALLERAFATTPIPIVLGDVVRSRPGLAPLHADPRWRWAE
jgi:serine/threonine protein kinase